MTPTWGGKGGIHRGCCCGHARKYFDECGMVHLPRGTDTCSCAVTGSPSALVPTLRLMGFRS